MVQLLIIIAGSLMLVGAVFAVALARIAAHADDVADRQLTSRRQG